MGGDGGGGMSKWINLTPPEFVKEIRALKADVYFMCDECKNAAKFLSQDLIYQYCPWCGAKMNGKKAVDAVRHGHWVDLFPSGKLELKRFECSECGVIRPYQYKYCPHCGALMF